MIIVNLKGGLGNQMFQYALGRKLAIKQNTNFKLDISGYPKQTLRQYGLSVFNIKEDIANETEIKSYKYPYGILSMAWRRFSFKILRRFHGGWEPEILNRTGNFYLDGFWQSYKYFDDIADIIRQDFSLKEPLASASPEFYKIITGANTVALHIRRSDYVTNTKVNQQFGSCSLGYYSQGAKLIAEKIGQPTFVIFSDDPEWVKNNLHLEHPMIFASDYALQDYQEMTAMSFCQHNIIANSSFSWWGAWLNSNPEKIVIAPNKWFNDGSIKEEDLIPPSWTKINRDL